jgi:hypothetical protein
VLAQLGGAGHDCLLSEAALADAPLPNYRQISSRPADHTTFYSPYVILSPDKTAAGNGASVICKWVISF